MGLTEEITHFVFSTTFSDLTPQDIGRAKNAFLDGIAVILAGAVEQPAKIMQSIIKAVDSGGTATVVGTRQKTSPVMAALANGVAGHCLDYDDVSHPMMGHPSTVLLPAILAAGETVPCSGRDALVAYAVGLEVAAKIGRIVNPNHYEQGWHTTSTLGVFGAAAATSVIMKLDQRKIAWAFGIAASQSSGARRNFGTMTKSFHAGHAARAGLLASLLARGGFTADEHIFDGDMGFLCLCGKAATHVNQRVAHTLGKPFELSASGLALKQYPCCAASHPVLDALLFLRTHHIHKIHAVRHIHCRVHWRVPRIMIYDRPDTGLQGKFSLKYCIAAAFLDGTLDLDSFTDDAVQRPEISRWLDKITVTDDLAGDDDSTGEIPTRAEVAFEWEDHSTTVHRVDKPQGSPTLPLSVEHIQRKFRKCASKVLAEETLSRAYDNILRIESLSCLSELTRYLAPPIDTQGESHHGKG